MARYPEQIERAIELFSRLPGVGRKTAERYVLYLLRQAHPGSASDKVSGDILDSFSRQLQALRANIKLCQTCYNFATADQCVICHDPQRNPRLICVVGESSSLRAVEQTNDFDGVYHVLGGIINHLSGIGPDQLRIKELVARVKTGQIDEVILAINADIAGEATSLAVIEALQPTGVKISRLARGLPAGSDIEYADDITLGSALRDRKAV